MPRPPPVTTASAAPILNDSVLQVTNALPPTLQRRFITKSIITQTQEALRIIQTKVSLGTLGKYDRQETRAAVLLDYVLRKQSSSSSNNNSSANQQQQPQETTCIDLKHLAAVNGTKLIHFQSLHQTLGNYFHDIYHKNSNVTFTATNTNNNKQRNSCITDGKRNATTAGKQAARSSSTSGGDGNNGGSSSARGAITTTRTILPDLSIRLAGYLQNPHAVTVQAARLLHNMRDYSSSQQQSAVERRGQEYDYVRYWPAYEAAAFFVVATTWQNALHHHHHGGGGGSPSSMASSSSNTTKRQRRSNNKNNKSGATATAADIAGGGGVLVAAGDDEDGAAGGSGPLQLKLEHLAAACNQFTLLELKEKLPHVQKMAAALVVKAQQEREQQAQLDHAVQKQQQQERGDGDNNPPTLSNKRARHSGGITASLVRVNEANTARRDTNNSVSVRSNIKKRNNTAGDTNDRIQKTSKRTGDIDSLNNHGDDDDEAVLSLDRWKECILSEARARVQNSSNNAENVNDTENSNGNNNDSLEQLELWAQTAADHVLQKYNLLLDFQQ